MIFQLFRISSSQCHFNYAMHQRCYAQRPWGRSGEAIESGMPSKQQHGEQEKAKSPLHKQQFEEMQISNHVWAAWSVKCRTSAQRAAKTCCFLASKSGVDRNQQGRQEDITVLMALLTGQAHQQNCTWTGEDWRLWTSRNGVAELLEQKLNSNLTPPSLIVSPTAAPVFSPIDIEAVEPESSFGFLAEDSPEVLKVEPSEPQLCAALRNSPCFGFRLCGVGSIRTCATLWGCIKIYQKRIQKWCCSICLLCIDGLGRLRLDFWHKTWPLKAAKAGLCQTASNRLAPQRLWPSVSWHQLPAWKVDDVETLHLGTRDCVMSALYL